MIQWYKKYLNYLNCIKSSQFDVIWIWTKIFWIDLHISLHICFFLLIFLVSFAKFSSSSTTRCCCHLLFTALLLFYSESKRKYWKIKNVCDSIYKIKCKCSLFIFKKMLGINLYFKLYVHLEVIPTIYLNLKHYIVIYI